MPQSIQTRFLPATNHRPARIKATAYAGSVIVSYDHAHDTAENHARAARALAEKFNWTGGEWIGGDTPDGRGFSFVNASSPHAPRFTP